jgi:hypothetical protein
MSVRHLAVVVATVSVVGASPANAQHTVNPVAVTAVSGYSSSSTTTIGPWEAGFGALFGIRWTELSNKPCHFVVEIRNLETGTPSSHSNDSVDLCEPNEPSAFDLVGTIHMVLGDVEEALWKTASFESNPRYVMRGVAVCTNGNANHRLKGIRVYAAKVWKSSDQVDALTITEQRSRPNCDVWASPVYCPANNVVTELVVHHTNGAATGLGLRCRPVQYP